MYEIPSRVDVRKCIIGRETIAHGQAPLLVTTNSRSGAISELDEAAEYRDAS
jgi:ATP-dependent protease Clp ATPase subunit